eukprot:3824280-Pyramimonas_sp.AAC.1
MTGEHADAAPSSTCSTHAAPAVAHRGRRTNTNANPCSQTMMAARARAKRQGEEFVVQRRRQPSAEIDVTVGGHVSSRAKPPA